MFVTRLIISGVVLLCSFIGISAQELIILHTNDTHSHLLADSKGRGGVAGRKAIIDSIRNVDPNVLLIDAGDAVQGTLFFSLYGGHVERDVMNLLGYDIQILGNHEFDNGVDSLASIWKGIHAQKLSTNYDLRGTALEPLIQPYAIRRYGEKSIGVIALNLNPAGMIAAGNAEGVNYLDAIQAANSGAWWLKHIAGVNAVIAVTHIGYTNDDPTTPGDSTLAANTRNIDIIIGGHSHTKILPSDKNSPVYQVSNLDGDSVLIAQTGRYGEYLGYIKLNLANPQKAISDLIPVFYKSDPDIENLLEPYTNGVDSLMNIKTGILEYELPAGSRELSVWVADAIKEIGNEMSDGDTDLAIINIGGIRRGLPKGVVTQGMIMSMLPFDNHIEILSINGKDLQEIIDIMKRRNVAVTDSKFNYLSIEPDRTYRIATIDYLATGGDYLTPLTRAKVEIRSKLRLDEAIIEWMAKTCK